MEEREKNALVWRMLRRLETRNRLLESARAARSAPPPSREEVELERVRYYLDAWVDYHRSYRPPLGFPSACTFTPTPTNVRTASEYHERSDIWAMQQVDGAIEEDLPALPDGRAMQLALRMRWLHVLVGAKVSLAGQLRHLEPDEVEELADDAERALVPILKRRHLPLI